RNVTGVQTCALPIFLGAGVLGVDGHLGVVFGAGVGLCGLFRVGLTGAAGPHGLGRRTSGDGLDGVGYGPVLGGGAAVGEHTDDSSEERRVGKGGSSG